MIKITYPVYSTRSSGQIFVDPCTNKKLVNHLRGHIYSQSPIIYSSIICHKFEYTFVFGGVYKMYPNKLFNVSIRL